MALTKVSGEIIQNPLNVGIVTATRIDGNVSGDVNSTGVSTFTTLKVGTGVTISGGIVTATTFSGALTGNVTGNATGLSGTPNITVGSIIASNATISGNVSVAGTLTYEDVTNVDSVGLVTARTGVRIDAGGLVVVGVTTVAAGSTAAPSITPTGDSNTGIFFPSADTIAFGEGGAEAFRITSSGNAGLATTKSYADTNASFGSFSLGGNGTKYGLLEINRSDGVAGSWIDCYGTSGNGDLRITTAGTLGAITFWTGGEFTEKVRITSSGNVGIGITNPSYKLHVHNNSSSAYTTSSRNTSHLGVYNPNTTSGAYAGIELGVDGVGNASVANISVIDAGSGSSNLAIGLRNSNTFEEKVRITSSGSVFVGAYANAYDNPGRFNVSNGSRVSTTSGAYVPSNGGFVDYARFEMISNCVTSFPANNNKIMARNGAPLFINNTRDAWSHYTGLPNYLLGSLTHDCINNTSFTFTLACTMTVFLLRDNGWNAVDLTGWTLIESGGSGISAIGNGRLYVKTLSAGSNALSNNSAMYFFVI